MTSKTRRAAGSSSEAKVTVPRGWRGRGSIHAGYIKGLDGPYCGASAEKDMQIQEDYEGEPLSEDEYHREVEGHAGLCDCGGPSRWMRLPVAQSVALPAMRGR